jgi:cytochrome c biogenesis protein CcmG, thiol:disulfide interchange protein DsbE
MRDAYGIGRLLLADAQAHPGILSATVFLLACLVHLSVYDFAYGSPVLDQPAPPLTATELDGQVFDLSKMHGKVVLVNYWATWCGPCKKEMPTLNEFYRRHHSEGLEIIGISTDRPEDYGKMRKVSRSLVYPTALFDQLSNNGFGAPEGFPLTYVIDSNGVIRNKFIDAREQLLKDVVLPLLLGLKNEHSQQ